MSKSILWITCSSNFLTTHGGGSFEHPKQMFILMAQFYVHFFYLSISMIIFGCCSQVEFEKQRTEDSTDPPRIIRRTLFGRMNPFPQKKVMTFNKHLKDFDFNVTYGDLDFMSEDQAE